ncbi:MAG TPA: molybdopterin-dependent oxidoreductase [Thermoanaerobaculia bacterium]|nr:molybdopterin-dependent oxidoreductase [Thermoanaerobaculia bacterium]
MKRIEEQTTMKSDKNRPSPTLDLNPSVDRRTFLQVTGALAATAAAMPSLLSKAQAAPIEPHATPDPVNGTVINSVCFMCHSRCGVKATVVDGVLVKLDGNPYHPNNASPDERVAYSVPAADAKNVRGRMCAKGQSYIQTLYDPARLKSPLKRVGPRGSGQWKAITWKQALDEIAAHLKTVYDPKTDIDPNFPEMGKVSNKIVFSPGRIQGGNLDFTDRIFKSAIGTANFRVNHTSICEVSHHTAFNLLTDYKSNHFKPDILNARYLIWFGTSPLEAGFSHQQIARHVSEFRARGGKMVTVDPRFSNTAARSDVWVPVKPGMDAAFALGMCRWIIDHKRYDENFLTNTKADVNGEKSYSDATFLVRKDNGKFLTAKDASGVTRNFVWNGGRAWMNHEAPGAKGELDPGEVKVDPGDGTLVDCQTVWSLFVARVREKTVAEYAEMAGVEQSLIEDVAREFSAAGKQGVANPYRGPVKHTNGVYGAMAIAALNLLNGNYDWKGGNSKGGGRPHYEGGAAPGQISLGKVPGGVSPAGVPITRHSKFYEKDAPNLFARDGYPAKRPWAPFNRDWNYQELMPSIEEGYPYSIDTLITYWNALPYSTPSARDTFERVIVDETKVKFFVAIDILIGEVSKYADIILPESSSLEKWSFPHAGTPAIPTSVGNFRQPVVGSYIEKVISGKTRRFYVPAYAQGNVAFDHWRSAGVTSGTEPEATGPQLLEDILIAIAGRMGLPGVGPNAFDLTGAKDGYDWRSDLYSAWDFYQNGLNNQSVETGATVEEIIAKGGVFAPVKGSPSDPTVAYSGNYMKSQFKNLVHLYVEALRTTKDSMTGQVYDPLPKVVPISDVLDRPIAEDPAFPYTMVTYKNAYHGQARTIQNPWLQGIKPENFVEINPLDGRRLGLENYDLVRLTGRNGATATGRVRFTEGIRPGVVAISHHYGHWESGGNPNVSVDGQKLFSDPARLRGIAPNPLMMKDPVLKNVCLQDKIGGSASFFDSSVKIERVGA